MAANIDHQQTLLVLFLVVFISFFHYQSYTAAEAPYGSGFVSMLEEFSRSGSVSEELVGDTAAPLVEETCRHTHYYDICVVTLKSDQRISQTNDMKGLLKISLDLATTNASQVLVYIQNWIDSHLNTPNNTNFMNISIAMETCVEDYNVSTSALHYAIEVVDGNDYTGLESYLNEALMAIGICQLSIRSTGVSAGNVQLPLVPLTNMNEMMVHLLQISMDMLCYLSPNLSTCGS